jgi:hypothetical protein
MLENNAVPVPRRTDTDTDLARAARPRRRARLVPIIVIVAAVALGVSTVVLDWGWVVWMLALGLCALGLFFLSAALGTTKRMLIVGGIAAVAVVVGGISDVRLQPVLPAGFAIGGGEEVVGRSGDTIVVSGRAGGDGDGDGDGDDEGDDGAFGVRGLSLSGDELWASTASADDENSGDTDTGTDSDAREPEVTLVDELVVIVSDDDTPNSAGGLAVGLDATTGDEVWSRELPTASVLQTATLETLVFSAPEEGTTALYLATGIPRWTNPATGLSTYRVKDAPGIDARVTAPNGQAWALFEGTSGAEGMAGVDGSGSGWEAIAINLDSGDLNGGMDVGPADYLMVGGVLVTQEYEQATESGQALTGRSVDGRVNWTRPVPGYDGSTSTMDAVDGDIMVLLPAGSAVISATTGELVSHELPEGSAYGHRTPARHARYEVIFFANGTAAAFDTVTGEHLGLSNRGIVDSAGDTLGDATQSVLSLRLDDAVGGRAFRYDVVTENGVQTVSADSDEASWHPGVLQVENRVVPLD